MSKSRKITSEYRQAIFSAYNQAKACGKFETGRCNRALGLALQEALSETHRPYLSTTKACTCPDRSRGWTCKHMIARMILKRAGKSMRAKRKSTREAVSEYVATQRVNLLQYVASGMMSIAQFDAQMVKLETGMRS